MAEYITFTQARIELDGSFISNELLPETPEEAAEVGEKRFSWTLQIKEVGEKAPFDHVSLQRLTNSPLIKQFNEANKAKSPVDRFIGLFKILEDSYGGKPVKASFKNSPELKQIAFQHLRITESGTTRAMSQVEFEKLINDLVNTRHECAHLRSSTGFGITYGDARVGSDVEPLLVPLEVLAYEIVKKRWSKPSILSSASDISVCWFLWILKPEGEPMYLFNNCKNRRHAAMYGPHAFYDLNKTGYQATQANNLSIGETCVVASKHPRGSITFDWYKFLRETVKSDDTGIPCRAFYGDHFKTETLSRSDAMRNGIYSRFFDINGNFKRHSVLRG